VPIYSIVVKTPPKQEAASVGSTRGEPAGAAAQPETNLGTEQLPAPSAKVWAAVARIMEQGVRALPSGAGWAMLAGGLLGIVLTLGEEFLPRRYSQWLPSAIGLGVAGVIPAFNSISMFLGALVAWLWMKTRPKTAEAYTIPISSGLIAGESLMGVALIPWT
jgi:uncharacterized oligopeptide transporter (OPT) family protein